MTATVGVPASTAVNTYQITINSNDATVTALAHAYTPSVVVQDYKLTPTPTAAVVTAGGSATFSIAVGSAGTATFDAATVCTGLPSLTTCSLDKTTATSGSPVTLTIKTTAPTVSRMRPPSRSGAPLWAFWLAMPGAAGLVLVNAGTRRRKLLTWLGLLLGVALLATLVACGGGGGSSTTQPPIPKPGTPAGTYTITVTGSFGSGVTRSTQVTLSVQ